MRRLFRKLRWLLERRRKEAELREELEFHLAEEIEDGKALGLTDDQARLAARRDMGSFALVTENTAAAWGWPLLDQLAQDLRYAVRSLAKAPAFAVVAMVSLALGVGANTAIISVVYSVLLKALPYDHPAEIHSVEIVIPERRDQFASLPVTIQAFLEWRRADSGFSTMTALRPWECHLTGDGEPERLGGARVASNFFSFLGVPVARGRAFFLDEETPGNEQVVVISDALWRRRYGGDPAIVGRTILINGDPHTVVGIAPPSLLVPTRTLLHPLVPFAERVDIWKPIAATARELKNESWDHGVLLRMPAEGNLEQGRLRLEAMLKAILHAQRPDVKSEPIVKLTPIRDIYAGKVRLRLLLVLAASALLLLTACANLANLFLARAASRATEMATRVALGAGRARILSQTLTETVVIAAGGGVLGAFLAHYGAAALAAYGPDDVRLLAEAGLNLPLFVFAMAVSLATALVCAGVPAWQVFKKDVAANLHEGARMGAGGRRAIRSRQLLIGVEMALGTALLASSALLIRSFVNVMRADRGYQIDRVVTVDLSPSGKRYATATGREAFYRELLEHIRGLPGVQAAGAISDLPATAGESGASRTILYSTDVKLSTVMLSRPVAVIRGVTAGYFAASGSALRAGRFFSDREDALCTVISESLATALWPRDPLSAIAGRTIQQSGIPIPLLIVGIVENARPGGVDRELPPAVYRPYGQWASGPMTLVVRTAHDPANTGPAVRATIRGMDPDLAIPAARTMREVVASTVGQRRFQMTLTLTFALVALLLAAVGLYGVVGYAVACRTRDIGLRIALGAVQSDVMRWVLADGMKPVVAGLVVGLAATMVVARILQATLFGIAATDPLSLAAVAIVLLATSGLACYGPARRAAALDPMTALRHD